MIVMSHEYEEPLWSSHTLLKCNQEKGSMNIAAAEDKMEVMCLKRFKETISTV